MAASTARTVKDVNPHEFVKAYSAHLKRSGKVSGPRGLLSHRVVFLAGEACLFGVAVLFW
jgi:hypothetical protein